MSPMKKQLVGIELRRDGISAVELRKSGDSYVLENTAQVDLTDGRDLSGALKDLFGERGFSRRAFVSLAPPDSRVFLNRISTTLPRLGQVRSVLKSQIEDSVPIAFEDIVADTGDVWQDADESGERTLLAAAINRSVLLSITEAFDDAGAPLDRIIPAPSALDAIARCAKTDLEGKDILLLHCDEERSYMAFYSNGCQVLVRAMGPIGPGQDDNAPSETFLREIGLSWRRLFGSTIPSDTAVVVSAPGESRGSEFFRRLPGTVSFVPPQSLIENWEKVEDKYWIPAALAVQGAQRERPNFLKVLKEETRAASKPVAHIAVACVLLAVLLALGIGRLYTTRHRLRRQEAQIEQSIEREFRAVFPELDHVRDTEVMVVTLRRELDDLQQRHDGLQAAVGRQHNPVALLNVFNRAIPEGHHIELDSIRIGADAMRVEGSAGDVGEAEELRDALSALEIFDDVAINHSGRSGAGAGFDLNISFR